LISVFPAALNLSIATLIPNESAISWPLPLANGLLETSATPDGPWALVGTAPMDSNFSDHVVVLPRDVPSRFYRLFLTP
jgi:hypothetical protein